MKVIIISAIKNYFQPLAGIIKKTKEYKISTTKFRECLLILTGIVPLTFGIQGLMNHTKNSWILFICGLAIITTAIVNLMHIYVNKESI
jgi:hypothetical protein